MAKLREEWVKRNARGASIFGEDKGIKRRYYQRWQNHFCALPASSSYGQADSAAIEFNEKTGGFPCLYCPWEEVVDEESLTTAWKSVSKDALAISYRDWETRLKLKKRRFGRVTSSICQADHHGKRCINKPVHLTIPTRTWKWEIMSGVERI